MWSFERKEGSVHRGNEKNCSGSPISGTQKVEAQIGIEGKPQNQNRGKEAQSRGGVSFKEWVKRGLEQRDMEGGGGGGRGAKTKIKKVCKFRPERARKTTRKRGKGEGWQRKGKGRRYV